MPRKGPDNVAEQRITLGTYERDLLKPILKAQATRDTVRTAGFVGVGLVATAGVVGVGWLGFQAFMLSKGLTGEFEAAKDKVKEAIEAVTVGLPSYKTTAPPNPKDTRFRDPNDPTKRVNPAAGVPIVGALVGLGMVIGEKTNPFSAAWDGQPHSTDPTAGMTPDQKEAWKQARAEQYGPTDTSDRKSPADAYR